MLDNLLYAVNCYLEDEYTANAIIVNIDNSDYIAFTINSHPLIYDPLEIVFYGMESLEKRDNWKRY